MAEEAIAVPAEEASEPVEAAAPVEEAPEAEPAPAPAEPAPFTPQQEAVVRQLILDRDKQWEHYNAQQTPAQPDPTPAPAEPTDAIETDIAALYTDDDAGRATRRSVETHFDLLLKQRGLDSEDKITLEDVERIAHNRATLTEDKMRSGLSINDEVADLVERNVISVDDARTVQSQYQAALSAPGMKEAAENPKNAPWILKGVVYDLVKAGKVKPFSKRTRPTNPLQPGGSNGSPQPVAISDNPADSPFAAVRSMSKEQLASARATSDANYRRANG
jgi:hypothetical protein